MGFSVSEAQKINLETSSSELKSPERDLLQHLLSLAIKDLNSGQTALRKRAQWWVYKDRSKDIDPKAGYISFYGACQGLGLDPDWARRILRSLINSAHKVQTTNRANAMHAKQGKYRAKTDGHQRPSHPH
jgi:hypothetical protein